MVSLILYFPLLCIQSLVLLTIMLYFNLITMLRILSIFDFISQLYIASSRHRGLSLLSCPLRWTWKQVFGGVLEVDIILRFSDQVGVAWVHGVAREQNLWWFQCIFDLDRLVLCEPLSLFALNWKVNDRWLLLQWMLIERYKWVGEDMRLLYFLCLL